MILKPRFTSNGLKVLRALNKRVELTPSERQHYLNLEKGYEGEVKFDALMEGLHPHHERLVLNDLLLEKNNTQFQLDSVHIAQQKIYHFEVKNYEGDFYAEGERWYTFSGTEIQNPINQLTRSNSLLRQLLQKISCHLTLESYIIFVNPEFHLYQAPRDPSIIFPTQLNRFFNKLFIKPSMMNENHTKLAKQLLSMHQYDDPHKRLRKYMYDEIQEGMTCSGCGSFSLFVGERRLWCDKCGHVETLESAIVRSVEEFNLLFPDRKITTNVIFDWCKVIDQKRKIRRSLQRNFHFIANGKWSYFE